MKKIVTICAVLVLVLFGLSSSANATLNPDYSNAGSNGTSATSPALLYDVDFSEPYHTLGQQINTDNGPIPRRGPSRINFGEQIVRTSFGLLTDRPAEFIPRRTPGGSFIYSQIQFDIRSFGEYPIYRLDFDLCINNMPGGEFDNFVLFYDVPVVVRLDFEKDGTIRENDHLIDSYEFGELLSMSILVNLLENVWSISCNSEHLYTGQFFYPYPASPYPPTYIGAIRFSISDDMYDVGSPHAAIDDIKIFGIPEPGTVLLLGLGGLSLLRKRSRQATACLPSQGA